MPNTGPPLGSSPQQDFSRTASGFVANPGEDRPNSTFALVELADQTELREFIGPIAFKLLSEAFIKRLEGWPREIDRSKSLGNNRYCVVFRNMDTAAQCDLAAAKLARLLAEPIVVVGDVVVPRVHIGFVLPASKAYDMTSAIHMAEVAIGQARKRGELFRIYSKQAAKDGPNEQRLIDELETAVERGEFELFYQPKMHAGFRTIVGAEALIRWHRPDKGLVPPAGFIEIAERNPVIRPMTWFVLKSAIGQCAQWPDPMSIAVNIPPTLLLDDEIVSVIDDALAIHGLDPKRLTLEVTEGVMMRDTETVFARLRQFRAAGMRVAIDDFGTGYSSLAYFRDLPADELKIDKCFVMNMASSPRDAAIVHAVVTLAHTLGFRVVAEGVETEAAAVMLHKSGCDVLQGYWISRPIPIEAFAMEFVPRH